MKWLLTDQREIKASDIMLSFIVGIVFGVRAVYSHWQGRQTEVVLPGSVQKRRTTAGAEETMGNKTIQRWSWLYTPNPAPTRLHLNVWFGIYFHPQFSGTPWLHIRGCIWNGGLGEESWEMQRERSGVGCLGLAWQVQPFIKAAWQVFQEWGEWVSERTSSDMKPSQQTWILLFHDLNKVLVLVTFRTPALMSGRHSGSSLTGTLFDPVVLRPTSTHIGSLTSSLMLPY